MVKPTARPRRRVVGRGVDRLVLDVTGQGVVEVELLLVQLEGRVVLTSRLVKSFLTSPVSGSGKVTRASLVRRR